MAYYYVKDPAGKPLFGKDLPDHLKDNHTDEAVAYFRTKIRAKGVRDYMGGGKESSVIAGFTVSKSKIKEG
jgi:hypothetical protein